MSKQSQRYWRHQRVPQANKADQTLDEWEDKLVKLGTEYGQELTAKVKLAVLLGTMPNNLQDKVLDECAVNWDETTEFEAGRLYRKIKATLRNIAKARREMAGPKPMEVDRVADWREWPDGWYGEHGNQGETEEEHHDEKGGDDAYVQYIGKGGGKKGGKGFQGYCYICGGFGTRSGIASRARAKGKISARTVGMAKAMARMETQAGVRQRKGRRWQGRHAEGLFWVWVYGACHQGLPEEHERPAGRPRDSLHRQRSEQRSTGGMEEDAHEGHSWRLRKGQSQGADPEDSYWSDGRDKEQVQGA